MKRELFQNVVVQPYTSGDVVEKRGFLSAVIGAKVSAAGPLTVTVTHSDDGTTFEPVKDELVFLEKITENGILTTESFEKDDIANIDLDLVGLKDYIKIEVTGADSLALALGDSHTQPV